MELPDMSRELKKAAKKGDTNFLKDAIKRNPSSLLTELPGGNEHSGNIFHIAAWNGQVNFIDEAIKDLPDAIRNILLFHHDRHDWTPLHAAVFDSESSYAIVKLILDYYDSMPTDVVKPPKPWLELTNGKTPLHMALEQDKKGDDEASAMELLLMDVELLSNTDDENGNSPLFLAVKKGYSEVAAKILTPSSPSSSISFSGSDGSTPLHFAPNCSEKVFKLLLRNNFSESIDKRDNRGYSALHQWAEIGKAWPCKLLLESRDFTEARTKIFKDLVCAKEINNGDTPLHISAKKKESNLCQILVQGYRSKCEAEIQEPMTHSRRHELECQILNNQGESPFFTAVMMRCESAVVEILSTGEPHYNMLVRNDGTTVLHYLHLWPEESGRRLLEKFWWMIKLANDENITPLDKAKQNNTFWLVTLLNEPSLIEDKKQFDWIAACQRQETRAIFAFIDHCEDLQTVCREQNDTPLHHIEFPTYHDNQKFLKIPSIVELKNTVDDAGSTPLHRALERRNIVLSKLLLLDNDVDRTIRNLNGSTAMDLLAVLIKNDDWKQMCKLINVNPNIKTRYIQSGANLEQIRTTLSVVAALLATITFAAGFTLPGGFKSDTGKALLAKKPAFVVFLLADGVGMCSSMLVLFFLIWSLVSEPDMAHVLVDRSVYILVLSLYGTLIAFMTGIYTVIPHSSKWAAIFIIVMCSLTIISVLAFMTVQSILAYKDILHKVIVKLISKFRPLIRAACTRNQVRRPTVEEGGVAESLTENDVFNRT